MKKVWKNKMEEVISNAKINLPNDNELMGIIMAQAKKVGIKVK